MVHVAMVHVAMVHVAMVYVVMVYVVMVHVTMVLVAMVHGVCYHGTICNLNGIAEVENVFHKHLAIRYMYSTTHSLLFAIRYKLNKLSLLFAIT